MFLVIGLTPTTFAPYDAYKMDVPSAMQGPSSAHWFGTDNFGRDVLSRILHGTRASLGVALAAVAIAIVIGVPLGMLAGYFGRGTDQFLGRAMDILLSFPSLLLAVVIAGILGPSVRNAILAIAVIYTPFFFRVARGPTLSEKEQDYVMAAHAVGVKHLPIMVRHLLPNVIAPIVVQAPIMLSFAILTEASLSYLGLGIQPPDPSWGSIINEGRPYLQIAPAISIFPGLTIMLAVLTFNFMGDNLRDLLDPK
ncbi:ABC transporter permease [Chloroflexi bacterium TSY]|nr:ABC transporter permease [Chloroflexi bacterium TSY]